MVGGIYRKMIYLNDSFSNAGKVFINRTDTRDYAIEEKINIDVIQIIFNKYKIVYKPKGREHLEGSQVMKIKKTIINIYKHKDDLLM